MKNLIIAVSGKSGCGNTTISKIAADRLGLKFINYTFRSLAEETGKSLEELLKLAAADDSYDKELDKRQVQLARESNGCVIGSRLAIWMLQEADFKVYLKAKAETRAARIVKREGGDMQAIAEFTKERDRQDNIRYKRIYNIDNDDYQFADLIIDTDDLTPDQIVQLIIDGVEKI